MRNEAFDNAVSRILAQDARYPREAYDLLPAALDYTVRALRAERQEGRAQEDEEPGPQQHVSARQLADGFRDHLLAEYGPFAKGLLDDLNIRTTDDIGAIVYNLIAVGAFGKTEKDRREDFHDLYDFDEAFAEPFRCQYD